MFPHHQLCRTHFPLFPVAHWCPALSRRLPYFSRPPHVNICPLWLEHSRISTLQVRPTFATATSFHAHCYSSLDNGLLPVLAELGQQQGVDLPPEQLLMAVPMVLMFVTFVVMSGRHFAQRRERERQASGDQKPSAGPHPDPPQPSVD